MTKILFVIPGFHHGGTNRSLLNLLSLIDLNRYDIYIFSMDYTYGYYFNFFKKYKLINEDIFISSLVVNLKNEYNPFKLFFYSITRVIRNLLSLFNVDFTNLIYSFISHKKDFKNFNNVIAFQEGHVTKFVSNFDCKNKIAWIHCNYAEYLKFYKIKPEHKIYSNFEKIVCVSRYTKNVFNDFFPNSLNKITSIHNIINREHVLNYSNEKINNDYFQDSIFNIISIGRIDVFKRFSAIPKIADQLRSKKCIFKWYILGGGFDEEEKFKLNNSIAKYNLEDLVICLGEVDNPYPYIKKSNILDSTSISEAFPYVFLEAKSLNVPIISSDFPSASECLVNEKEGLICNLENIGNNIEFLIKNKSIYNSFIKNLKLFSQDKEFIINEFYKLLKK